MLLAAILLLAVLARKESQAVSKIYYRTRDGRADYQFSFERLSDGSIRPYIESMPSYGSRDTGLHTTHRLHDSSRRYYVCWNRPLINVEDVKQVVALWSDLTQEYIKTGRTIDQQMRNRY